MAATFDARVSCGCAAENLESLLAFTKSFDHYGWFRANGAAFDCPGL